MNKGLALALALSLAASVGCDGISNFVAGVDALDGEWSIQDTNLVFLVHSGGQNYTIEGKDRKDIQGTIDGTRETPNKLTMTVSTQIAPSITAKTTFVGLWVPAKRTFEGTYVYETNIPAGNRQGGFIAVKK